MSEKKNLRKKEVWKILSEGGFICEESKSGYQTSLYQEILENESSYRNYFAEIGFILEKGRGYYQFVREDCASKSKLDSSIKNIKNYIDICDIMHAWRDDLCPGAEFRKNSFLEAAEEDPELQEKIIVTGYADHKAGINDILKTMSGDGFIEKVDKEVTETYFVTSAYNYLLDLFANVIIFNEETDDETPE